MPEEIVVLGKIVEAYGIRGWVRIHPFADDPEAWAKMPVWWLGREGQETWQECPLKSCRPHGEGLVALLDGVADRNGAEALRSWLIGAPKAALPATAEDEYYWADLIGLEVVNGAGEVLGRVDSLIETGSNDVLVVKAEETERLLPFVSSVVLEVDKAAGWIRVEWGSDW